MHTNERTRAQNRPRQLVRLTQGGLMAAVWVGERESGKRQIYFNLCRENRDPTKAPYVSLRPEHLLYEIVPGLAKLCGAFTKTPDIAGDDRKRFAELALLLAQANEMFAVADGNGAEENGASENVLNVS